MMAAYDWRSLTSLGAIMVLLGLILILIPYLVRYAPEIENLPPVVLYLYRRNGFVFATSPILIAISIMCAAIAPQPLLEMIVPLQLLQLLLDGREFYSRALLDLLSLTLQNGQIG